MRVRWQKNPFFCLKIVQIKTKKILQINCTAYIVYTFHLSLHHANFGKRQNRFFKVHIVEKVDNLKAQLAEDSDLYMIRVIYNTEKWF